MRTCFCRFLLCTLLTPGCQRKEAPCPEPAPEAGPVEAPGLHNVFRVTERLYSGSSPDGDEGFQSLQRLGIRTIISVDGARPDVVRARAFGLRYVHVPIGYDGVPRDQALHIARAVRDLPGPAYLHCHHGKHRGPAAAAVVHLCLDPTCAVATVLAEMQRAGTDPHYLGLYASARSFSRPLPHDWERVPADFPETADVPPLAGIMVAIEERWHHLQRLRTAGWKTSPDLDPAHEARLLLELYREAGRLPSAATRPDELLRALADAARDAHHLETALRTSPRNHDAVEQAYRLVGPACRHCHNQYRDLPRHPTADK